MKERMKLKEKLKIAEDRKEKEVLDKILEIIEQDIHEQYEVRDAYPNSTKFIDICIDTLEELKNRVKDEAISAEKRVKY
jgi:hypothetical protein